MDHVSNEAKLMSPNPWIDEQVDSPHLWHLLGYKVAVRSDTFNCWVSGKISGFAEIDHICVEYTSEDLIGSYGRLM